MTPTTVREVAAPPDSHVAQLLPGAYFHDAWAVDLADGRANAMSLALRVFQQTPPWIDGLMGLRNRLAGLAGLKNVGTLADLDPGKPSAAYQLGDRVGIFTLCLRSEAEVLMGIDDKHLKVVVSLHRAQLQADARTTATITTVVHVHNWLGRLYMLPVTPVHRVIAKRMTGLLLQPA
ncbi:DUF2867 domain-containing protein [Roseateles sp. BYS180W]|uniref:DUF2867 domain-containing protein n=1 Tax=Roseateles rivi TaxID=3299028 RepID=A0ABW7FX32_9BURK